jgi:hypothetical protein
MILVLGYSRKRAFRALLGLPFFFLIIQAVQILGKEVKER